MRRNLQSLAILLALQLGARGQPIFAMKSPTRLPDPFTIYLREGASMTAEEHAKWATSVQEDQKNERNLPGVGDIFPASNGRTEGYTGSFTPETVDIIRDHPDVSVSLPLPS